MDLNNGAVVLFPAGPAWQTYQTAATGATSWRAWQDPGDTSRILEQFVVASWDEHLRQHERVTKRDQDRLDRVRQLTDPAHPVTVTHWLAVHRSKNRSVAKVSEAADQRPE